MAYRNGTYIAFHANGTTDPTASDIKYYNLIKAWTENEDDDFSMINSHDKTAAVRDSSLKETLRSRLITRLNNSKNMLLILGKTTKEDTDWVPFEIKHAIDECKMTIIAAYSEVSGPIFNPTTTSSISNYWPAALKYRIENKTAHVIHIPFKKEPIKDAINQFDHSTFPNNGGLSWYTKAAYDGWNIK
jgi:hypothetical protein